MGKKSQFVFVSTNALEGVTQTRKQQFARTLARNGYPVLYVDPIHFFLSDTGETRVHNTTLEQVEDNLWLYRTTTAVPLVFRLGIFYLLRYHLYYAGISRAVKELGFDSITHWTYHPPSAEFLGYLGEKKIIYDCVDLVSAYPRVNKVLFERYEQRLARYADLTLTTAIGLYANLKQYSSNLHCIPNGVNLDNFKRPLESEKFEEKHRIFERAEGRKLVGFLGTMETWIDLDLILACARKNPDLYFACAGKYFPDRKNSVIGDLAAQPNVHLMGPLQPTEVPEFLDACTVLINPFIMDDLAKYVNPLKVYDYLASGKPIVSVPMPEIMQFEHVLSFSEDPADFVRLVKEKSAAPEPESMAAERRKTAEKRSWTTLCDTMLTLVEQTLES